MSEIRRVASIDLSTGWAGIALLEREAVSSPPRVVTTIEAEVRESHAVHVVRLLERALGDAGWSRSSLDGFVATRGPGSFTGIRIALGTIRGLGIASGRPTAAVPTLDAMAEAHGPAERERVAILAAGRGQIFAARFDAGSRPPRPIGDPWLGDPSDLAGASSAVLIPMRGHEALARTIADTHGHRCADPLREIASSAGWLALTGHAFDRPDLAPLYLRPPVAELARDGD